ncbi:MAG: flagellar hook-associated protein FlgK [Gammaproteobacteria bacterium]
MSDLLGTGVSGLLAMQQALATTSHNISNVNTDGYTRQRVELGAQPPQFNGGLYTGSGVQVESIQRVYNQFLTDQVRTATSLESQHQATHDLAVQVDNMLADPQSGLTPAMQKFFNAVQDLASSPTSSAARQVVLSQAQTLTSRFNDMFSQLDGLRSGVNTNIQSMVKEVNTLAQSIANVNQSIVNSPRGANGQLPNDLLDQRDQLINQLSQYASIRTMSQSDGTVNVFIGNGQSLVVGTKALSLSTVTDAYDPTRQQVAYVDASGNSIDISNQITGGKLGGTLDFRDNVLDPAINGLGRVAIGLEQTVNAQHKLGQDLNGNPGGDFFSIGAPQLLPNSANTGNASISAAVSDASALTTSNYVLQLNGGTYTLTRLSDGAVTNLSAQGFPGSPVQVDGVTLTLNSGAMANGDKFLLRPTHTGAQSIATAIQNTSEIAAAAPIVTGAGASNTGSASVSAGTVNSLDPNLQQPVTITFNNPPTSFNVSGPGTGSPTNVPYTSGGNIAYNGWTIQINGTPAAGDQFTVTANTDGTGDNRNALLLAGIQNQTSLDGGTSTLGDAYGSMVAGVGTRTKQAELAQSAQQSLLTQATSARDSVSGVNLDEEAANLVRYQQGYQAAAHAISVASTLFDSLLSAVGG